ncbi:unnamed protein product, partial [Prorocentrum cordatum]
AEGGAGTRGWSGWSREEMESLPAWQLAKWLEDQGVDVSPACDGARVLAALRQRVEVQRPPDLASAEGLAGLRDWPLAHQLRWLDHLGGVDEALCSRGRLVQLVLERERDPPAPAAAPESPTIFAQVAESMPIVRQVAATLLSILSSAETQQAMARERDKHGWVPNGVIVKAFQRPAQGCEGDANGSPMLDVAEGDHVDVMFDEAGDWAWCALREGTCRGWVPRGCVAEVAQALE